MMNIIILENILKIFDKLIPNGDKKLEAQVLITAELSKLKQPLALSIMAFYTYSVYVFKSIYYRMNEIVYFNTVEFYFDILVTMVVFSFLYNVDFNLLIKSLKGLIDKYILKKR